MSKRKASAKKTSSGKKVPHSAVTLQRQQLGDLEHKLSMDIGSYLVLNHEGSQEQIEMARQRARMDLLKYGPDMQKLAYEIGGSMPEVVQKFISSLDDIVHAGMGWIDEQQLHHCFKASETLENELQSNKKTLRKKKA